MPTTLDFNLDNLPVDVFDLADTDLKIESLTAESDLAAPCKCGSLTSCLCISCTSWAD